jgi:quinol monooxygenase YgiN
MHVGGISERGKEIKRRRHRRKKLVQLTKRLKKATVSEKGVIAAKVRRLTPGAEVLIEAWGLGESHR